VITGDPSTARLIVAATGAYQLAEAMRAHDRLGEHGIDSALVYIAEPGRLRLPRDSHEAAYVLDDATLGAIFPPQTPRVFITHMRPEPFLGALRRLDTGPATTKALGFINRGGTLDIDGLLFANRCTWAHVLGEAASVLAMPASALLDEAEFAAFEGRGNPRRLGRQTT
jgi:phosphoketolase